MYAAQPHSKSVPKHLILRTPWHRRAREMFTYRWPVNFFCRPHRLLITAKNCSFQHILSFCERLQTVGNNIESKSTTKASVAHEIATYLWGISRWFWYFVTRRGHELKKTHLSRHLQHKHTLPGTAATKCILDQCSVLRRANDDHRSFCIKLLWRLNWREKVFCFLIAVVTWMGGNSFGPDFQFYFPLASVRFRLTIGIE